MSKSNVILIGMPGSGKSTVGVVLAKTLLKPFMDTDLLIQQKESRFLQEIINREGIEKFLSIEEKVIREISVENHVISTGGSAILRTSAVEHLKEMGTMIYLKLPFPQIQARIRNIATRGIAMGQGQGLLDIYNERVPLYEASADYVIDCLNKNVEQIVLDIHKTLNIESAQI